MYLVYSITAYPFGMLADRFDRRLQIRIGAIVLIVADAILAGTGTIWWAAIGVALWGLHLGATQAAIGAIVADVVPDRLRGTAFGIYDLSTGVVAFAANAGAGALWLIGGPAMAFGISACIAVAAALMLVLRPFSNMTGASS